jgi:hypothetical protein
MGRLLITFLLCQRAILSRPLLYLSHYFKQHRAEYYDRLMAVRTDGHWEQWIKFFLRGVSEVSLDATATARKILLLRETSRTRLSEGGSTSHLDHRLLDLLFENPLVTIRFVASQLGCSFAKASQLIESFQRPELALVEETTGFSRNRRFRFKPYLDLFPEAKALPRSSWTTPTDIYARCTITPTGTHRSIVTVLRFQGWMRTNHPKEDWGTMGKKWRKIAHCSPLPARPNAKRWERRLFKHFAPRTRRIC